MPHRFRYVTPAPASCPRSRSTPWPGCALFRPSFWVALSLAFGFLACSYHFTENNNGFAARNVNKRSGGICFCLVSQPQRQFSQLFFWRCVSSCCTTSETVTSRLSESPFCPHSVLDHSCSNSLLNCHYLHPSPFTLLAPPPGPSYRRSARADPPRDQVFANLTLDGQTEPAPNHHQLWRRNSPRPKSKGHHDHSEKARSHTNPIPPWRPLGPVWRLGWPCLASSPATTHQTSPLTSLPKPLGRAPLRSPPALSIRWHPHRTAGRWVAGSLGL